MGSQQISARTKDQQTIVGLTAETYTFLFTDIVGSTALMQSSEEAMVAAVDLHDSLLPPLLQEHGGHVFKNMGDAYCAAFTEPLAALQAAIAGQRALQEQTWDLPQPLQVRMAMHSGPAQVRGDDYRGLSLSRVARLMKICHGGQVLLSDDTGQELSGRLPREISLLSLGSVRLPSLERPERVYQLLAPGLARDFPSPRSLENLPNNLKDQLSSFVGREREMAEVMDLCLSRRLVTLTGTGGCGKTRLALQAAAELIDDFEDGVWLVELAGIADPAVIPFAVAAELKVRQDGSQSVEDALIAYLKSRRLLLVLDNCEHLIDASAGLAQRLLQNAPNLKILATSRERLNIAGETAWRVPPLSVPGIRGGISVDSVLESDAASLFIERAVAAHPQFRLSAGNAKSVAQVCRRLEGLPLALELAASRVGVMSVEQFAARLDDRLRALPPGPRGGAARHRTLQATLDWSYELLTEQERMLLCRLSVFSGGWTLEAAEAICAGDGVDETEILDLLSRLVDKSLVVPEDQNVSCRYRLSEPLRAYSLEKLSAPSDGPDWRACHASYFLEWAETAEAHLSGLEHAEWLKKIERDHDNIRAALTHLSATDAELFQRLASALYPFWYTRGYLTEGRTWLDEAVAKAEDAQTIGRAKAINRTGIFAWAQGDLDRAMDFLTRGLEVCRLLGDDSRVAAALNNLSMIASNQGAFQEAQRLQEEALNLYRSIGDGANVACVLHNLGATAAECGDEESAQAYYRESIAIYHSLGDEGQAAHGVRCLGESLYRSGHYTKAEQTLREGLIACNRLGDLADISSILSYLGYLALEREETIKAVHLLACGNRIRLDIGTREPSYYETLRCRMIVAAKSKMNTQEYDNAWNEGMMLSLSDAVELSLNRSI